MLFYARDGFFGLRTAVDIAAWRGLHPPDGAPVLRRHWREHPRLRRAFAAAALAAERVVGVPRTATSSPSPRRAGLDPAARRQPGEPEPGR